VLQKKDIYFIVGHNPFLWKKRC